MCVCVCGVPKTKSPKTTVTCRAYLLEETVFNTVCSLIHSHYYSFCCWEIRLFCVSAFFLSFSRFLSLSLCVCRKRARRRRLVPTVIETRHGAEPEVRVLRCAKSPVPNRANLLRKGPIVAAALVVPPRPERRVAILPIVCCHRPWPPLPAPLLRRRLRRRKRKPPPRPQPTPNACNYKP